MVEFVEYAAKQLVQFPEQVEVKTTETEGRVDILLFVAPEDMGKMIGKQGKIARAIRTILKAGSAKSEKEYFLDIREHNDGIH